MKEYFFYYKNDLKKEPLYYHKCGDEKEALQFFSNLKKLDEKIFLKIFTISKK